MFNPDKDFNRKVIETLGKEGKSISALTKDLESQGIKHHRLILTGYLRALTDLNILREKEIPPSKIYIPIRGVPDSIYISVEKAVKKFTQEPNEVILYVLYRMFKRPIFESELKVAGVMNVQGKPADPQTISECKRFLKRAGNVVPSEIAYEPSKEFPELYPEILAEIILDAKDSKYLVMGTVQMKLI